MINGIKKENVLFLDVETIPQYPDYNELPESKRKFWDHKASFLAKSTEDSPELLYDRAGIYAEFGKVICISTGYISTVGGETSLHIKSFSGDDEKSILVGFSEILNKVQQSPQRWYLCAHNGKEFDFPYICRRLLANGLPVPNIIDPRGKYQKEVQLIDTMELWKFGDYKSFVSLDLLAEIFDIPSPKDNMDGSMVKDVYYEEKDLNKITQYCNKDVITLVQVLLRFKGEEFIKKENIVYNND